MKHLLRALCAIAFLCTAGAAMAQGTVPLALSQSVDINGKPQAGALLYTYVVGTVAQPQNTFQDTNLTIQNPWPLTADQNGRLPMFYLANGSVHVRLTDSAGNVQYDNPSVLVIGPSGGSGGGGSVDPTTIISTGDIKVKYGTGALSGFVRANGLTLGNSTSGATERANADTQNLFVFLYTSDPNLVVSGGRTGNALNDYNSSKTITLPDWRGRVIAGLADMGNSASSVLTATYCSSPTTLGFPCGSQNATLAATNLPTITTPLSVTSTTNFSSGLIASGTAIANFNCSNCSGGGATNFPVNSGAGYSGITSIASSGTGTSSGTNDTPFGILQPMMLATIYIKL